MGRKRIDREAFEVGFKGVGLVHGVNTRPLVCWVSSARSADARKARFLVEFNVIYNRISFLSKGLQPRFPPAL